MLLATGKAPVTAIAEIDEYIEMEWAEDVMMKAASLKSREAIRSLPKYAGYTWSRSILEFIATSSPGDIFEEMEFIEYQPWAGAVVEEAASRKPEKASELRSGYQDQAWGPAILKGIEGRKLLTEARLQSEGEARERRERQRQRERERREIERERQQAEERRQRERERQTQATQTREKSVKKITRRDVLSTIAKITGFVLGGYYLPDVAVEVYHFVEGGKSQDEKGEKSYSFKKLLEDKMGINIGDEILPKDIHSVLTDKNLSNVFWNFPIEVLFEKEENGDYKFNFPENTVKRLENTVDCFSNSLEPHLYPTIISDGMVTMGLELVPYHFTGGDLIETGFIFKDRYITPLVTVEDYSKRIEMPNWLAIKVDKIAGKDDSAKITVTLKQTPLRPISETIEFVLDNGNISNIIHYAEIQDGISPYKSEVIHSPEGQAAIKEKRRKAKAKKIFGK